MRRTLLRSRGCSTTPIGGSANPDVVLYNASARAHGPIAELDPEAVLKAIEITAFGGFLYWPAAAPSVRNWRAVGTYNVNPLI
jgi:hypothetical protein